ncbi:hypothetical protein CC80DRAFT_524204 [Byssothecium circinans]|uniref:BTB domain-containing protein n=1 Tax=Byssothecium circinans TaxID=147558 RepID=A0A6A5U0T7_9PLEO|nr:hypothetical protein CC80DRAFT_524204 [Byssothecium circinans]
MTPSFAEIIQSDLFTFYVGTGEVKDVIRVPSKAISATSDSLKALIEGRMSEAETKSAELKDIETEDFIRFVEYAFRRDYTVPAWIIDDTVKDESPPPPCPPTPEPEEPSTEAAEAPVEPEPPAQPAERGGMAKGKKGKNNKAKLRTRFNNRKYFEGGHEPKTEILASFIPQANTAANQDFTPVLLGHARLYTFADMYLIEPLKSLALHKIHQTLLNFKLYHARIGDIVELVRYAYDRDTYEKKDGGNDELRKLVVDYMACEVDIVGKSKEFEALMEEGGKFVVDFWKVTRVYLVGK